MQAWIKIVLVSVCVLAGCSLQMEEQRNSVALFAVRPAVPSPGEVVPNPIQDPLEVSSADFEKMQDYRFVCMQVIGADGKFGTPIQEMVSEETSESITGLAAKFSIPKLWVGRKYSIRVFGFKSRMEVCPFEFKGLSDFAQLGVLDNYVVPDKPSEVRIPVNFWESSEMSPPPPPSGTPVLTITSFTPNLQTVELPNLPVGLTVVANVSPTTTLTYEWYAGSGSGACQGTYINTTMSPVLYLGTPASVGTFFYCVIVKATGATPVSSSWAQVNVTNGVNPPPATEVTGINAQIVSGGIQLTWSPVSGAPSYWLSRSESTAQTSVPAPPPCNSSMQASSSSFTDTQALTPGNWYKYRVCVVTSGNSSTGAVLQNPIQFPSTTNLCQGDLYQNAQNYNLTLNYECPGPPGPAGSGPTTLRLQYANGSDGFMVWREWPSLTRILNATGLVAKGWQKKLNAAGTEFGGDLTDSSVISQIAGRACHDTVYKPGESNPGPGCLYYDAGNAAQALNASGAGTPVEGIDYLTDWNNSESGEGNSASFFEGNIYTCNVKGMPLPVIYETTASAPNALELPATGWLSWPGLNGVPAHSSGSTWTATARKNPGSSSDSNQYFTWTNSENNFSHYVDEKFVRCVLPAFYQNR